ncbi:hypothetical protein IT568_08145 [bacterium]|nr:hypothetical protein [bacterium]
MNKINKLILFASAITILSNACGSIEGSKNANKPPTTEITLAPFKATDGSIRTSPSRVNVYWKGIDEDGYVTSFWVASVDSQATFASLGTNANPETATTGFWKKTTRTDSIFNLVANLENGSVLYDTVIVGGVTTLVPKASTKTHTIFIKSIDNEGLTDSEGDLVTFNGRNIFPDASVVYSKNVGDSLAVWGRAATIQIFGNDPDGDLEGKEFSYQFRVKQKRTGTILSTGTDGWSNWIASSIKGLSLGFGLDASAEVKEALPQGPNIDEAGLLPITAGQNSDTLAIEVRVKDFGGAVSKEAEIPSVIVRKDFQPIIRLKHTVNDSSFYFDNSAFINPDSGKVNLVKFTWDAYFDPTNGSLSASWSNTYNDGINYLGKPYKFQYSIKFDSATKSSEVYFYDTNGNGTIEAGEGTRKATFSDQNEEISTKAKLEYNKDYTFNLRVWDTGGAFADTSVTFMLVEPEFNKESYTTSVTINGVTTDGITQNSLLIIDESYSLSGNDYSALAEDTVNVVYQNADFNSAGVDKVVYFTQSEFHQTLYEIIVAGDGFISPRILGKFAKVVWYDEDGPPKGARGSADDFTGLQSAFTQVSSRTPKTDDDLRQLRWARIANRTISDYTKQGGKIAVVTWRSVVELSKYLGGNKIIGTSAPNITRFAEGDFLYDTFGLQNANPETDLIMGDTTAVIETSGANTDLGYPDLLRGKRIWGSSYVPANGSSVSKIKTLGELDSFTRLAPFAVGIYKFRPEKNVTLAFGNYDPTNKPGQTQVADAYCGIRVVNTTTNGKKFKLVLMTLPLSNLQSANAKQLLEAMVKDLKTKD